VKNTLTSLKNFWNKLTRQQRIVSTILLLIFIFPLIWAVIYAPLHIFSRAQSPKTTTTLENPVVLQKATVAVDQQITQQISTQVEGALPKTTALVYLQKPIVKDQVTALDIPTRKGQRKTYVNSLKTKTGAIQTQVNKNIRDVIDARHVVVKKSFFVDNVLLVELDEQGLAKLKETPGVVKITPDYQITLEPMVQAQGIPEWNITKIGADRVWNELGIDGTGIVVANIDTGVQWDHPALKTKYRGFDGANVNHDYNWYDPSDTSPNSPLDNTGHGTHTMGSIVGGDTTHMIGIAPGAKWIAAKGCASNICYTSDLLAAGQWMLAPTKIDGTSPDAAKAPDIINNSWSGNGCSTGYAGMIDVWRNAGIIPVFSAGNSGPSANTIGSPGDLSTAISVGAVDSADTIASFSSRGPTCYGTIKPDLVAPGIAILSSIPYDSYKSLNGTSMATPQVAGVTALLLQAKPDLTPDAIISILKSSTTDLGASGPDNTYGSGLINAYKALTLAPSPTMFPAPTATPILTPTPTLTPPILGPGELPDIAIIPSVDSNGVTTITVSGPRVTSYPNLTAKHIYFHQSGDSGFTPVQDEVSFTLTKTNDVFKGSADFSYGCIDFFASAAYIASTCIAVMPKPINGLNMSVDEPDTRLPYRYVNGKYEWAFARPEGYISGSRTSTDRYFILSMTMPFDKTITPRYAENGNFAPTNYYWTDSITDESYNYTALKNIYVTKIPTPDITCSTQWAMIGVYSSLQENPKSVYSVLNTPYASGECVFYTYPNTHPIANFSEMRNTYMRLIPYQGPTPTPSPTPIPTPTPTPTSTPTPTPTPIRTIQIQTPNGGETLIAGAQALITWTSNNAPSISIYLVNPANSASSIILNKPNVGYYLWNVSKLNYPNDTQFKIRVLGGNIFDESDGYFTIATPTPSPTSSPTPAPLPTATPTPTITPTSTPTPAPSPQPTTMPMCRNTDLNKDGIVDQTDVQILLADYWSTNPKNARSDINRDGIVDLTDYSLMVIDFDRSTGKCL